MTPRLHHEIMRAAPVLLVSCLLIAACGGGSDSAAPPASSDAATTSPPPSTVPTTGSATTVPTTDAPDDTTAPTIAPPSTDPPAPEKVTVESPDGNLMLTVDRADFDRVSPTIKILDPADWPPEVAGGANLPGVTLYDLQPDGATFDTPVSVTRRVDAASFPDLGPFDVPLVTLLTYSDGEYELLDGLSAARLGDDIYVTGSTSHFSNLLTSSEGGAVSTLGPADLDPSPGISIREALDQLSVVTIETSPSRPGTNVALRSMPSGLPLIGSDAFDALGSGADFELRAGDLTIAAPVQTRRDEIPESGGFAIGAATARFELSLGDAPSAALLLGRAIGDAVEDLEFEASLFLALVPDEMYEAAQGEIVRLFDELDAEIDLIVEVFHEVFGVYPSSIRRRYLGLPRIPAGYTGLSALFEGDPLAPRLVSIAPIDDSSGDWETQSGIECYCEYNEMLFFFDDAQLDVVTAMLDEPDGFGQFWVFAGANTDVVTTLVVTDTQTGDLERYPVSSAEGTLVTDTVAFETVP